MVKPEDIARAEAQHNGIVLIDSTITGIDQFLEMTEFAETYEDFDLLPLDEVRDYLRKTLALMREPNTYTTDEAKIELEDFSQRLQVMQKRVHAPYVNTDPLVTESEDTNLVHKQRRLYGLVLKIKEVEDLLRKKVSSHHNTLLRPHEVHYGGLQSYVESILGIDSIHSQMNVRERNLRACFFAIGLYYAINEKSSIAIATNRHGFDKSFDLLMSKFPNGINLPRILGIGGHLINLDPSQFRLYTDLPRTGNFELYSGKYESPTQTVHS